MDVRSQWDDRIWISEAEGACSSVLSSTYHQARMRDLSYELAMHFGGEVAHAVTSFPEHIMSAWNVDRATVARRVNEHSPISQGTPQWRDVERELARLCLTTLEQRLCDYLDAVDLVDPRGLLRRVCFDSVHHFLFFVLGPESPARE